MRIHEAAAITLAAVSIPESATRSLRVLIFSPKHPDPVHYFVPLIRESEQIEPSTDSSQSTTGSGRSGMIRLLPVPKMPNLAVP